MSPKEKEPQREGKEPQREGVRPTEPVSRAQEKARGRFVRDSQLPPSEDCSTGFDPEEVTPKIEFPEKINPFSEIIEFGGGEAKVDLDQLKAADALPKELPKIPMSYITGRQQSMQGRVSRWSGVGDAPFLAETESPKEAVVSGIAERIKRMKSFPEVFGEFGVHLHPYFDTSVAKKGEGEDKTGSAGIREAADALNPFFFKLLDTSPKEILSKYVLVGKIRMILDENQRLGESDKEAIITEVTARKSEFGRHGKTLDDIVREEVQKHLEEKRTDPK